MQQLTVAGLQLEYRDFPATRHGGPTLLLLHEGLGSLSMWGGFPERLAAATGCRLLVWSRAGHGGSAAYAEPRTPRYLHREAEEALPALLTAFGIQRPVLIGHSDGGSIALLFAAACAPAAGATSPGTGPLCVSSGSGVTDYFPSKVTVSDLPSSSTTVVLNATTVRVKTQTAREPGCLGGGRHSSSRPGPAPA